MDESNTYLLQTHILHYLTSGRDLVGVSRFTLSNDAAILVGNPAFSNSGETIAQAETRAIDLKNKIFPPLTNTQAEVEQISDLIPGEQQVYTQTNATEALLKTHDSPTFLHLATHGFFEDDKLTEADNPLLRSGLVFAGVKEGNSGRDSQGNLQDGILTALEVSGLDLTGTQLVVMSACQSGLGSLATGEGVYGLRRAFTLAGVQTQVMSLWQVADRATQAFMVSYYQNLQAGQPRGDAIRATQLSFLNGTEYKHPYYWSAFISSGNWQPLTLINK
jgi:CHAT domain-containing protein